MITNYVEVVDYVESPVLHLIHNSYQNGDYEVCLKGCNAVLNSIDKLNPELRKIYLKYYIKSTLYLKKMDILEKLIDYI
jgi:hypothetical protein